MEIALTELQKLKLENIRLKMTMLNKQVDELADKWNEEINKICLENGKDFSDAETVHIEKGILTLKEN